MSTLHDTLQQVYSEYQAATRAGVIVRNLRVDVTALKPLKKKSGATFVKAVVKTLKECPDVDGTIPKSLLTSLHRKLFKKNLGDGSMESGIRGSGMVLESNSSYQKSAVPKIKSPVVEASLPPEKTSTGFDYEVSGTGNIGKHMGLSADQGVVLIDGLGTEAGPDAAPFELFRNSLHAVSSLPPEDRLIHFGIDEVVYDKTMSEGDPILNFAIIDNGCGMTETIMHNFSDISSSSKVMGLTGSKGLGARISAFANSYCSRLRVYSWTEDGPEHGWHMTLLRKTDPKTGLDEIGAEDIGYFDEFDEYQVDTIVPVPAEYVEFFRRTTGQTGKLRGTMIIGEGGPGTKHTFFGPRDKGGVRFIQTVLIRRSHEIEDLDKGTYKVYEVSNKDPKKWAPNHTLLGKPVPGGKGRYGNNRTLEVLADTFHSVCKDYAEVILEDGTKIEVWSTPEEIDNSYIPKSKNKERKTHYERIQDKHSIGISPTKNVGLLWIAYKEDTFSENYTHIKGQGATGYYHSFGISNRSRKYLNISVTPPRAVFQDGKCVKAGVAPNTARNELSYYTPGESDSVKYPWQQWGDEFRKKTPPFVKEMVAQHTNANLNVKEILEEVDILVDEYKDLFSATRTPGGSKGRGGKGTGTGGKGTGTGGKGNGPRLPRGKSRYVDLIEGCDSNSPFSAVPGASLSDSDKKGSNGKILLYTDAPIFDREVAFYSEHVVKWSDDAEALLRRAMIIQLAFQLSVYYMGTATRHRQGQINSADRNRALEAPSLTGVADTLLAQRSQIRSVIHHLGWQ